MKPKDHILIYFYGRPLTNEEELGPYHSFVILVTRIQTHHKQHCAEGVACRSLKGGA